jgi:type II secretory pathway component GspD/PulD (secretin)
MRNKTARRIPAKVAVPASPALGGSGSTALKQDIYMKAITTYSLLARLLLSIPFSSAGVQDQLQPTALAQAPAIATNIAACAVIVDHSTNGVLLDFRGASLSQVLDYLSEAAGFIIINGMEVHGTGEVWSKGPVTRDEAVELLNTALESRGSTVIRNGRILTIDSVDHAKTADLAVITGNDPNAVQKSEAVVTQIIPIRYADASRVVNNLRPLLPSNASLSVNEDANALILVDNKTAIRRMLKIISALDTASARFSTLKVIPLRHAEAKELATLVQQMYSTQSASQGSSGGDSSAQSFGPPGAGGFGPPGFGGLYGSQAGGSTGGTATAPKVVATADERANALIVSAPADLIPTVANLVQQLDQQVNDVTQVRVFRLHNADPAELVEQLAQLYPDESGTGSGQARSGFSLDGPPGPFGDAGTDADTGERRMKQGRVLAVADPRGSSLLVSAGSALIPQIAALIKQLDADAGRKEMVSYWNLRNADPQDVKQILQDLFNRNVTAQNNNNENPLLGQNNPLIARQTQQQSSTTASSSKSGSPGANGGSSSPGN